MKKIQNKKNVLALVTTLIVAFTSFAPLSASSVEKTNATSNSSLTTSVAFQNMYFAASNVSWGTKTEILGYRVVCDEYSNWHRCNAVFTAHRAGETASYSQTKTVSTTTSVSVSAELKSLLKLKLGRDITKSVSSTFRGGSSAPLKKNESAAFYYRNHYRVYDFDVKISWLGNDWKVHSTYECIRIKIPVKLNSKDYGWFYGDAKALTKTLNASKKCNDYTCKVK